MRGTYICKVNGGVSPSFAVLCCGVDTCAGDVLDLSAVKLDNDGLGIDAEDCALGQNVAVQEIGPGKQYALAGAVCGEVEDAGIHDHRGRRAPRRMEIWEDSKAVCLVHSWYLQWD